METVAQLRSSDPVGSLDLGAAQLHAQEPPDVGDGGASGANRKPAPHAIVRVVSENRKGACSLLMGLFLWHDQRQTLRLLLGEKKKKGACPWTEKAHLW